MKNWFHTFRRYTAYFISKLYPPEKWYSVAYTISRWMVFSRSRTGHTLTDTAGFNRAWKLNSLLAFLTRTGRPFPIPVKAYGTEIFQKQRPHGLIVCSTHLPLVKVALRHLAIENCKPDFAIAADLVGSADSIALWGITDRIPAIKTGAHVLTKTRTALQKGNTVMALVDKKLGEALSPNLFQLAHKLHTDIVFCFTELQPDGCITIHFMEAPFTGRDTNEVIAAQLAKLHYCTNTILKHYSSWENSRIPLQPSFHV